MKLDHVNLCSSDVPALSALLQRFFRYRVVAANDRSAGGDPEAPDFAMLIGPDASNVVITRIDRVDGSAYPDGFHVGLGQDSREAVLELHARLREAGLEPDDLNDGFEVLGATWTAFYLDVGDGLRLEVNHHSPSTLLDP